MSLKHGTAPFQDIAFEVRVGEGAALPRRGKGELPFEPFCGVRTPENGPMAKGGLLLRLTALRRLHGWDGPYATRAFLSPLRAMPPSRWRNPQRLAWEEAQPGLCSNLNPQTRCRSLAWDQSHGRASLPAVPVWQTVAQKIGTEHFR